MKIENVKTYGITESMIASGYPMRVENENFEYQTSNLEYWMNNGLRDIIKTIETDRRFVLEEGFATFDNGDRKVKISFEDITRVSKFNWRYSDSRGYLRKLSTMNSKDERLELHRFIANNPKGYDIDHINRDKDDYRRNNLRICTRAENTINRDLLKTNTSGYIGVHFRADRNRWVAGIEINKKRIGLGSFQTIREAIIIRLQAEKDYFGEFAPQRHLFEQFGMNDISTDELISLQEALGFVPDLKQAIAHYKRINTLANSALNSGHDQALTGMVVQFDLTFSNKAWVELQRYNFVNFVSSQSTMHCISKFNLTEQYNEYVDERIIKIMEELKEKYNETHDPIDYLKLLYSNPAGFQLTARLTTNYRQLKTIYAQRKTHRLPEWREFCRWIETLPCHQLITAEVR